MTEKVMIMESANNTRNPTLGVVQNVRLSFGPITLTLHIQVVDYAPFEVLLGRPFSRFRVVLQRTVSMGILLLPYEIRTWASVRSLSLMCEDLDLLCIYPLQTLLIFMRTMQVLLRILLIPRFILL